MQRPSIDPVIYDYHDHKIEYLERLFQKRNVYYKRFIKEGPLFEFHEPVATSDKSFSFENQIQVPIEQLEFKFGIIAFKYQLERLNKELVFEIPNTHMRLEFEVLKPYFAKLLKSANICATIKISVDHGKLIYNYASSDDVDRIDREIIDGFVFDFCQKIF